MDGMRSGRFVEKVGQTSCMWDVDTRRMRSLQQGEWHTILVVIATYGRQIL